MLRLFWYFVCERQSVWYKRFCCKLDPPWTKDIILQKERFTNVYRELDPGTIYAINNILEVDAPKQDKIFNTMFYRLVGSSNTHKEVGFQKLSYFNPEHLEAKMKYIRDVEKKSVFTAAYMVSGYSKMGSKDKVENVVRLFTKLRNSFDSIYSDIQGCKNSEEVYNVIRGLYGFGNFLSYQILVDLLYPLRICKGKSLLPYSHDDWASAGPGAKIGIELLLKKGLKFSNLDVMMWLRKNQCEEFLRFGLNFNYLTDDKGDKIELSLANIQNCLCEFHKYIKIRDGTGRGRRKFTSGFFNVNKIS
ncbi:hypothetical protein J4230_00445 [Candidatus Woesearchaeota archaeon]|nr:hypothetical protein [Candidatus Woesearchaeota archaeon]